MKLKPKDSKLVLNKVKITKLNDDSLAEIKGGAATTGTGTIGTTWFTDPFFTHHDLCCTCTIETNCNCPE